MGFYRALFAFDVLVVLVLGYFFVDGLRYAGAADSLVLWLPVLGVPIALLVAAETLRAQGRRGAATAILGILAVPPAGFVGFFGLLILLNPRWN